jgi:hypothetical protein
MKTFKNSAFKKRDYEATNIVCCQAESIELAAKVSPGAPWVECDESELTKLDKLWIQAGVSFYGYM